MRHVFLFCLISIVSLACANKRSFGQQDNGTQTLEDLLKAESPATAAEELAVKPEPVPVRPKGTLARPKDGVQHPDLDKAWAEYNAVVAELTEGIRAAIKKEFDAAAAKGDLDLAEKWDGINKKFESGGDLELEGDLKPIAKKAAPKLKAAKDDLGKAYESVVKALTMEKRIPDAKAAKSEFAALNEQNSSTAASGKTATPKAGGARSGAKHDVGGWTPVITSMDDFKKRWKTEMGAGNIGYDEATGVTSVRSWFSMGTVSMDAPWDELKFDLAVTQLSGAGLDLKINGVVFNLGQSVANTPQGTTVHVRYLKDKSKAVVTVGGVQVNEAVVFDDAWPGKLRLMFYCGLSDGATFRFKNLMIRKNAE